MKWDELLNKVSDAPFFTSGFLMAGENETQVRLQISRWLKSGRLIQLRRGLYSLSPTYCKNTPQLYAIANALQVGSYVSLQSALAYYNLIPEYVPSVTSVSSKRPEIIHNTFGSFQFRHISKQLLFGLKQVELVTKQLVFIAEPEKALFDLIYLTPGADAYNYLTELRLQYLDTFRLDLFYEFAAQTNNRKLLRAGKNLLKLISEQNSIRDL